MLRTVCICERASEATDVVTFCDGTSHSISIAFSIPEYFAV
jgi:hypothetical protein